MSAVDTTGKSGITGVLAWLRNVGAIAFSEALRVRGIILLVLLALHIAASVLLVNPGHYSIDEGIYHQMARDFAQSGTLESWNGYDEFPSLELTDSFHIERDGRLYSQYPYLAPVVVWPFYEALGYRGLFALNAIAYIGIAVLCFAMARRIFADTALALDSVIVLTIGTFAWEYSQAGWPHMLAVLSVTAALYLTVLGLTATDNRRMIGFAFAAGSVIGLTAGIRLDVLFASPAVLLPYILMVPSRPRPAVAALIGMLPGFAILAATNYAKFDVLSPFSYGTTGGASEPSGYIPVALLGLLGVAALWLATRPRSIDFIRRRPVPVIGIVLLLAGLALLVPSIAKSVTRIAVGASQLLVDLRLRNPDWLEPGMRRSATGAMIYFSGLKKALSQSLPWLPLLALPLAALFRPREPVRLIGVLFLSATGYIAVYSYYAWHGGLALNLRYFLPFLPAFAILGAWAFRELAADAPNPLRRVAIYAFLVAFNVVIFSIRNDFQIPEANEGALLTMPLVLASLLSVLLLLRGFTFLPLRGATFLPLRGAGGSRARRILSGASLLTAAAAMGWASAGALSYDYLLDTMRRRGMAVAAQSAAPLIERDSIIFALHELKYFGLYEHDRVRIAGVLRDNFKSFRPLLDYHLDAGRPVYLALEDEGMEIARRRGLLDGLSPTVLSDDLVRVYRTGPLSPADTPGTGDGTR